jgi:small subunit ribosomal protein S5
MSTQDNKKETKNDKKDQVKAKVENIINDWKPKTELGRKVKSGEINDIDQIIDNGLKILEPEIVDILLPDLETDLLLIGQSKGKFGGGSRRVFRQTQKKTREGNKPKFSTYAVVGNKDGYVGIGFGKAKETIPAREKAIRNAKLNIIKIRRGCGSWECGCNKPHSIPFEVKGKEGSVEVKLMPAPQGKGLIVEKEIRKILNLAGVKDIWSKSKGQTKVKVNMVKACFRALKQLTETKIATEILRKNNVAEGKIKEAVEE